MRMCKKLPVLTSRGMLQSRTRAREFNMPKYLQQAQSTPHAAQNHPACRSTSLHEPCTPCGGCARSPHLEAGRHSCSRRREVGAWCDTYPPLRATVDGYVHHELVDILHSWYLFELPPACIATAVQLFGQSCTVRCECQSDVSAPGSGSSGFPRLLVPVSN